MIYAVVNHQGRVRTYLTRKGAQNGFRTACYRSIYRDADVEVVCQAQREYDNIAFNDPRDGLHWRGISCKPTGI